MVIERDPTLGPPTREEVDGSIVEWRTDAITAGLILTSLYPRSITVAPDYSRIRLEGAVDNG